MQPARPHHPILRYLAILGVIMGAWFSAPALAQHMEYQNLPEDLGGLAASQVSESPSAQKPGKVTTPEPPPPHHFWDRENVLLFSGVALFRGLDYASTRNMQARGREEILLPDDVVNNSAGFAGLEAAGAAASVGISYWMHRSGHHKLERWVSIVHLSVTGFGVARNYALDSRHQR